MVGVVIVVYDLIFSQDGPDGYAKIPGWAYPEDDARPVADSWSAPTCTLQGEATDLLMNSGGLLLMSSRMRDAFEACLKPIDRREWLPFIVEDDQRTRTYYAMHLLEKIEGILDTNETVFNRKTGEVIKPQLRADAIGERSVFSFENALGGALFVTSRVKDALVGFTGCSLVRIRVSAPRSN